MTQIKISDPNLLTPSDFSKVRMELFEQISGSTYKVRYAAALTFLQLAIDAVSGGASVDYNTLKKIEDNVRDIWDLINSGELGGEGAIRTISLDGENLPIDENKNVDIELIGKYVNVLQNLLTKEPTGFSTPDDVNVSYDPTTRKITLTGNCDAYFNGVKVEEIVDGFVSIEHNNVTGNYFLHYDGTQFVFNTTPWLFSSLMIAYVQYNASDLTRCMAIRETHGLLQWQAHKTLHETTGTYKTAGGDFSAFVLNSTTVANRRPDVSNTTVFDEDLQTIILSLSNKSYTQRFLTGAAVRSFNLDQNDIIPLDGNVPYYNQNVGGTWQQTPFPVNHYGAIFVVAVPTTSDTGSQKYRYMFVQPQQTNATLNVIQALTPNGLTHGETDNLVSEFVFIGKIIIRYTANNWVLTSVEKLSGTRTFQVSNPAGAFLTIVTADSTLKGDGTPTNPLSLGTFTPGRLVVVNTDGSLLDIGDLLWDNVNRRFGVRVSPGSPLHVKCSGTAGSGTGFRIEQSANTNFWELVPVSGILQFSGNGTFRWSMAAAALFSGTNIATAAITLRTSGLGWIDTGDNFGFGTKTPTKKVHIAGTAGYVAAGNEGNADEDFASHKYVSDNAVSRGANQTLSGAGTGVMTLSANGTPGRGDTFDFIATDVNLGLYLADNANWNANNVCLIPDTQTFNRGIRGQWALEEGSTNQYMYTCAGAVGTSVAWYRTPFSRPVTKLYVNRDSNNATDYDNIIDADNYDAAGIYIGDSISTIAQGRILINDDFMYVITEDIGDQVFRIKRHIP